MENTKRIIWTNNIDIDDWKDDIKEWYDDEELTDEEIWDLANRENDENLEDEKANLNKELGRTLVVIGRLGLWNGIRHGWKLLKGTNLNDIFSETCGDYVTWYVEDEEICCEDIHHDGTNHYTYRVIKEGITDWEFEELMAEGTDIDTITEKLGHYVAEIYGF